MRESLKDIASMVVDRPYPKPLPRELEEYHVYVKDNGHSILCVLSQHIEEAIKSSIADYEIPVPVKYVLENGYKVHSEFIEVSAEYNYDIGIVIDDKYLEY